MSFQKQGGSMRYDWLGPEQPISATRYTVGGRSVHATDAASGISKGTAKDTRRHVKVVVPAP